MSGRRKVMGRLDLNGHESPFKNIHSPFYSFKNIIMMIYTVLQKSVYRIRSYLKNHGGLGGCYPPNRLRLGLG